MGDQFGSRIVAKNNDSITVRVFVLDPEVTVLPRPSHKAFFLASFFFEPFKAEVGNDKTSDAQAYVDNADEFIKDVELLEFGNFPPTYKGDTGKPRKNSFGSEKKMYWGDFKVTVQDPKLLDTLKTGDLETNPGFIPFRDKGAAPDNIIAQLKAIQETSNNHIAPTAIQVGELVDMLKYNEETAEPAAQLIRKWNVSLTAAQRKEVWVTMMEGQISGGYCALYLAPTATDSDFYCMLTGAVYYQTGDLYLQAAINAWRDKPFVWEIVEAMTKKNIHVDDVVRGFCSLLLYKHSPDEKIWKKLIKTFREGELPLSTATVFNDEQLNEILAKVEKDFLAPNPLTVRKNYTGNTLLFERLTGKTKEKWYNIILNAARLNSGWNPRLFKFEEALNELAAVFPERQAELEKSRAEFRINAEAAIERRRKGLEENERIRLEREKLSQ